MQSNIKNLSQDQGSAPPVTSLSPTSLYIHIPFCFHKCHYCDFYSIVDHKDRQNLFLDAVLAEIDRPHRRQPLQPETIFVGGGTPTLLAPALWERLLDALAQRSILDRVDEFTVEANPETVTAPLIETLNRGNVNRLSIGAQSFHHDLLKTLERWHDPASVSRAVSLARQGGIDNINLDLIFAIPGQTFQQLDADLDAALALEPDHLACYSLIFEPNTPLTQRKNTGVIQPVDEQIEAEMYQRVIDRLAREGFEHYEISNWARPGKACAHNLAYWLNHDWLGVGPAAASHIRGHRWKNRPHLGAYLASPGNPPTVDHEQLSPDQSRGEQLMLRLRLIQGIELDWLEETLTEDPRRAALLERYTDQGLLVRTSSHLRLSPKGLMVADALASELL